MLEAANRSHFFNLSRTQQQAHASVLRAVRDARLSCRCEVAGTSFHIVVAPGLSAAQYWLDKLDIDEIIPANT